MTNGTRALVLTGSAGRHEYRSGSPLGGPCRPGSRLRPQLQISGDPRSDGAAHFGCTRSVTTATSRAPGMRAMWPTEALWVDVSAIKRTGMSIHRNGGTDPETARHLGAMCRYARVRSAQEVQPLEWFVVGRVSGVDAAGNRAPVALSKPGHQTAEDEWDRTLDVNRKGAWMCTRGSLKTNFPDWPPSQRLPGQHRLIHRHQGQRRRHIAGAAGISGYAAHTDYTLCPR